MDDVLGGADGGGHLLPFGGEEEAVGGLRHQGADLLQPALVDEAAHLRGNRLEVLVVGDSYKKDIVPAESIGCRVLWLKGKGWTAEEDAVTHPCIIKNLSEVSKAVL